MSVLFDALHPLYINQSSTGQELGYVSAGLNPRLLAQYTGWGRLF